MPAERDWEACVYRALLIVYPAAFREAHRSDLTAWFREHRDHLRGDGRPLPSGRLWSVILRDLLASGLRERWASLRHPPSINSSNTSAPMYLSDLVSDVRIAVRGYLRRPLFTILVVSALAAGIGSSTAIYSVVESVLLTPLPYPGSEQLYRLGYVSEDSPGRVFSVSYPNFVDVESSASSFASIAASRVVRATLATGALPSSRLGALVSPGFFDAIGVEPALGRVFDRDEYLAGARLLVASHGFWRELLGGDPDAIGRSIVMDGSPAVVVGVLPADFLPPEALGQGSATFWAPLTLYDEGDLGNRRNGFLTGLARLAPDITQEMALSELTAISTGIQERHPEAGQRFFGLASLREQTVGDAADTFRPFAIAVGLLMMIACVNVANLLLVRAGERSRELAVRAAIGADRSRIVWQLLLESAVLAAVGGAVGIGLARLGTGLFIRLSPGDIPRIAEVSVSGTAVLVGLAITAFTAVAFGLLPAVLASRIGSPGGRAGGGPSLRLNRVWDGLIALEAALALLLVLGAGLLANSFVRMNQVDLGFDPGDLYSMSVRLPPETATDEQADVFARLTERLEQVPGVRAAAASDVLPFSNSGSYQSPRFDEVELGLDTEGNAFSSRYQRVTPGYFATVDAELVRGRAFSELDRRDAPLVAVVNESLVRRVFGELDPIGQRFGLGEEGLRSGSFEIVGVVGDARSYSILEDPGPEIFFSSLQIPTPYMHALVEADEARPGVIQSMKEALEEIVPGVPALSTGALDAYRASSIAGPRFYASLLAALAGTALLLALVGVYGTLSWVFAQRAREMSIRKALGAGDDRLTVQMVRRGMTPVAVGVALGLAAAVPATRLVESFVFEIEPTDPATLALTCVGILGTALIASLVPALRATSLDPMSVLREE